MPMRRVNNQRVHSGVNQGLRPLKSASAHANSRSHPQTAIRILARVRIFHHLLNILNSNQPFEIVVRVHNRQFFNPVLFQNISGLVDRCTGRRGDQVFGRHNLFNRPGKILLKAQIAVSKYTHQTIVHRNRHAGNMITRHQFQGVFNGVLRRKKNRINNNTMLRAFNPVNLSRLLFNRHIFMNNANAALSGNGNRHTRFGNRIHAGAHQRNIQPDMTGKACANIHLVWQHTRFCRYQQHIIKSQAFFSNFRRQSRTSSFFPKLELCPF